MGSTKVFIDSFCPRDYLAWACYLPPMAQPPTQMRTALFCLAAAFLCCATIAQQLPAIPAEMDARVTAAISPGTPLVQTRKVDPTYPTEAKAARLQGAVVLKAKINKEGKIASLHIVSGPEMLKKEAYNAIKQWEYQPYEVNGKPTELETTFVVSFWFPQH